MTAGLGFFFWMAVARFYTQAEVGLGAAIISAILLSARLSTLGLGVAMIRFLPKAEKPVDMINSCFTLSGIVALAVAGIFIAGINVWSPALKFMREPIFGSAFAFYVLFWTLARMADFALIAGRRAEFVLSNGTIFSSLKIPLAIVLAPIFGAFGVTTAWGIAVGVSVAVSLLLFLPRVQNHYRPMPKLSVGVMSNMWRYSAGNYLVTLFEAAPVLVLPIMVVNIMGAVHNAYFYVAWMIASLLFAIAFAVSQSLFAEGSHFEAELRINVRRSFKFIFSLLIPAVVLIYLLGNWLLSLFGEDYVTNVSVLLWILSLSSLFIGVNSVYRSILLIKGRIKELAIISGSAAATVLLGSYFVMPATGTVGIGYVWLVVQGLIAFYVLFALRTSRWEKTL